jgi:hypothetical protein
MLTGLSKHDRALGGERTSLNSEFLAGDERRRLNAAQLRAPA